MLGDQRIERVAIVDGGPSIVTWFALLAQTGKAPADLFDEVWVTGSTFRSLRFDRAFVSREYDRVETTGLAGFLSGVNGTVYMPNPRTGWRADRYPIDRVMNAVGRPYFACDTAYALGMALSYGVTKVSLFGCETDSPVARASIEYLCGLFEGRGGKLSLAPCDLLGIGSAGVLAGYSGGALVCPGGEFRWAWGDEITAEMMEPSMDIVLETAEHAV